MFVSTILVKILATKLGKPNAPDEVEEARDVRHGAGENFLSKWRNEGDCLMWVLIIFSGSFMLVIASEIVYYAMGEEEKVPLFLPLTGAFADFIPVGLLVYMHQGGMRINKKDEEERRAMYTELVQFKEKTE